MTTKDQVTIVAGGASGLGLRPRGIVTIAPGTSDTPTLQGVPEGIRDSLGSQVPQTFCPSRRAVFGSRVGEISGNPMLNGEVIGL
ncbi:hypothetical protein GCM10023094_11390 [Rhodococcus olei]|uniref:Uncharacterized protein n=1 Tax=Rhodococcus olei TaxID=2161675 RepID=A0ABP8NVD7_9NOCA